jgi:hypothetical protein
MSDDGEQQPGGPRRGQATRPQRPSRPRPVERPPFPESRQREREWWLRCVLVLVSPRAVFTALRDDRDASAEARQEPMIAILFLSGLSIFFASRTAGRLYDNPDFDPILIAVEAIVTIPISGLQNYWLGGLAVHLGLRGAGAGNSYRQARHLVGLAQVPLALALLTVFPLRLAVFGSDMFRSGGADGGVGGHVFDAVNLVFLAWALTLLVIGARTIWSFSWLRTLRALALSLAVFAAFAALVIRL